MQSFQSFFTCLVAMETITVVIQELATCLVTLETINLVIPELSTCLVTLETTTVVIPEFFYMFGCHGDHYCSHLRVCYMSDYHRNH